MIKVLLGCLLLSAALTAQSLPDNPKPQSNTTTYTLLAIDLVVREMDAWTTVESLNNPRTHEQVLPDIIAKHPARIYLYGIAVVGTEYMLIQKLKKHHRKLARLTPIVDIAIDLPAVVGNLIVLRELQDPMCCK